MTVSGTGFETISAGVSSPPHLVAKAAAQLDETVFESIHEALMDAYFEDNRDISLEKTLKSGRMSGLDWISSQPVRI